MIQIDGKALKALGSRLSRRFKLSKDDGLPKIYECVYFEERDDQLIARMYNLQLQVDIAMPILDREAPLEEGVWIDIRDLTKVMAKAGKRKVFIGSEEGKAVLRVGSSSFIFELPTESEVETFELFDVKQRYGTVELEGVFLNELTRALPFTSTDDARRLDVVALRYNDVRKPLQIVATDGHKLYAQCHRGEFDTESMEEMYKESFVLNKMALVDRKDVLLATQIFDHDTPIQYSLIRDATYNKFVLIEQGGSSFLSKIPDHVFPDFTRIALPRDGVVSDHTGLLVSKETLIHETEMSDIAVDRSKSIRMAFSDVGLELTANANGTTFRATVPAEVCEECENASPLTVGMNHKYLTTSLKALEGDEIEVWAKDTISPVYFYDENVDNVLIVMPVRL